MVHVYLTSHNTHGKFVFGVQQQWWMVILLSIPSATLNAIKSCIFLNICFYNIQIVFNLNQYSEKFWILSTLGLHT